MAVDQTEKAKNIAIKTVEATDQLMEAFEALRALEDERQASGLILSDYDQAYAETAGLSHVDGAALDAVLNTSIPAIWLFMVTEFHVTNLQKVRP